jgi:DNA-directed RNA polymerase specialized sigma24 family protein
MTAESQGKERFNNGVSAMILLNPILMDQFEEPARPGIRAPGRAFFERVKFLAPDDRLLVELAMEHRLSRRQIGQILKIAPGSVSRRLRRLVNRLKEPMVMALANPRCTLQSEYRQVGIEHFIQLVTVTELARNRGISLSQARSMVEYVRGWHGGLIAQG